MKNQKIVTIFFEKFSKNFTQPPKSHHAMILNTKNGIYNEDTPAPIPLGTTSRQRRCYLFPHTPSLIRVKKISVLSSKLDLF